MNKCVYCQKDVPDMKFKSLMYAHKFVCECCVLEEDVHWFSSKNIDKYPDFTKEIAAYLKALDTAVADYE